MYCQVFFNTWKDGPFFLLNMCTASWIFLSAVIGSLKWNVFLCAHWDLSYRMVEVFCFEYLHTIAIILHYSPTSHITVYWDLQLLFLGDLTFFYRGAVRSGTELMSTGDDIVSQLDFKLAPKTNLVRWTDRQDSGVLQASHCARHHFVSNDRLKKFLEYFVSWG
jgi:hypothetical protein